MVSSEERGSRRAAREIAFLAARRQLERASRVFEAFLAVS
jgi:hypothetical protein